MPNTEKNVRYAVKTKSNFVLFVVNPLYSFVITILSTLHQLSSSAAAIPYIGPAFALFALSLMGLLTFFNKKASPLAKVVTLLVLALAVGLIGAAIRTMGIAAAAPIGIAISSYMLVLQSLDLVAKYFKQKNLKEEKKCRNSLLDALSKDNMDAIPLTDKEHKWANVYYKIIQNEINDPNITEAQRAQYSKYLGQLTTFIKRFAAAPEAPITKNVFYHTLSDDNLKKLPINQNTYQLAILHKKELKELKNKPLTSAQLEHVERHEGRIQQFLQDALSHNFENVHRIFDYLTTAKEHETQKVQKELQDALKKGTLGALPLNKDLYKWAIIYLNIIKKEQSEPYIGGKEAFCYPLMQERLEQFVARFDQGLDFDKTEVPVDDADLESLLQKKHRDLEKAKSYQKEKEQYRIKKEQAEQAIKQKHDAFKKAFKPSTKVINNVITALRTNTYAYLPVDEENYRAAKYLDHYYKKQYGATYKGIPALLAFYDEFTDPGFDKAKVDAEFDDFINNNKALHEDLNVINEEINEHEALNAHHFSEIEQKIGVIIPPLKTLEGKIERAELNFAYANCDLFLAIAGLVLAVLGLASIIAGAPITIPAVSITLAVAVGVVSIARGCSKFGLDLFHKMEKVKRKEELYQQIEDHILHPEEKPNPTKSSDLLILTALQNKANKVTVQTVQKEAVQAVPIAPPAPTQEQAKNLVEEDRLVSTNHP